jgi:hypothetical protein
VLYSTPIVSEHQSLPPVEHTYSVDDDLVYLTGSERASWDTNLSTADVEVFDPGFETDFMGTLLYVHETLFIEENARVAQIYFHECAPAEKYDGQWQGDKQRNSL